MKKPVCLLFFLFLLNPLFSQVPIKLYYDSLFNVSKKIEAKFYREVSIDTNNYVFEGKFSDYTTDKIKILTGNYENGLKEGEFIFYNSQGEIYAKGNFENDSLNGIWKYYYSNGQIKSILKFDNSEFKVCEYFNKNGGNLIPNGTGEFRFNFINNFENDIKLHLTGLLLDSMKVKKWKIYDGREKLAYDNYENNVFKSSDYYNNSLNSNNAKIVSNDLFVPIRLFRTDTIVANNNLTVYDYPLLKYLPHYERIKCVGLLEDSVIYNLDSMPEYIGGLVEIRRHISKNIRYPFEAMEKKIAGKVYMEIIIDENGKVIEVIPARESNKILVEEAERVLMLLSNFKPGYYKNKKIKTKFVYPITFNSKFF